MKILVPIKRVADPDNANKLKVSADGNKITTDGLEWKPNPFDEYAVESALRLNENAKTAEKRGEVIVITIGSSDAAQTLRQPLAMGADRAILVKGEDEILDSLSTAQILKAVVEKEKPDLVLMGKQVVDGDSNAVGQMLGTLLDWPTVTFAMSIELAQDQKTLRVGREVDTGVLSVEVQLPAIVTVDLRIVSSKAVLNNFTPTDHTYSEGVRYASLKGIMAAKKKPLEEIESSALGVSGPSQSRYFKFELPKGRSGSAQFVDNAQTLVQKLHSEAKVI